jgi:hypothetical protein
MRIRHRIPTVFSLYMVDVFCCALGCVLLIWLDQSHTASQKLAEADKREEETQKLRDDAEKRAGSTSDLLTQTEQERDAAYLELAALSALLDTTTKDREELQKQVIVLQTQRRELDEKVKDRNGRVVVLETQLAAYLTQLNEATGNLEKTEKDKKDIEKRLAVALAQTRDLDGKMKDKTDRVVSLEKELATYLSQLNDAKTTAALVPDLRKDLKMTKEKLSEETALALALENEIAKRLKELTSLNKTLAELRDTKTTLEKTVDVRDKDLAEARVYKSKWEAAEERVQALEKQMTAKQKELALAELNNATLTKDKKAALEELTRMRGAEEARFAGIQLTGKRVVFLVDMSGSMDLIDDTTEAPTKWLGVRETVQKIMRSLPELEKFQVIIFSEKANFLFGDGDWIDYDPRTSSDKVFKALAAIKPKGGTNMYTGMETAFKLRAKGLDTMYFLSDGLPNLGEGLTREQAAKMTELQVGEVLGKVIRKKLKTDWNRPIDKQPAVRINTIGFFFESPDVGAFLWALAREHDGSFVGMSKP